MNAVVPGFHEQVKQPQLVQQFSSQVKSSFTAQVPEDSLWTSQKCVVLQTRPNLHDKSAVKEYSKYVSLPSSGIQLQNNVRFYGVTDK